MVRHERTGNRTKRSQRQIRRNPDMGYFYVVTDTEATERCFFEGLHRSLPLEIQDRLVIKVVETKTKDLIQKCLEGSTYDPQYRSIWIVFDRDQLKDFDQIVEEAQRNDINVGWSNPCFEIWMYAYFGKMPSIPESTNCCSQFKVTYEKKTGHKYKKSDEDMYNRLIKCGDEKKAIKIARQKHEQFLENGIRQVSEMCPCTTVYKLVDEIRKKAQPEKQM